MKNMITKTLMAAALVFAPMAAAAATVSGQIDITGNVNLAGSDFTIGDAGVVDVDLLNPGLVNSATGDFGSVSFGDLVALTDIDFDMPGAIWSVGGFTFTAGSFADIVNGVTKSFTAYGTISHGSFDDTAGTLTFTAQSGQAQVSFSSTTVVPLPAAGFLLLGALGGLGLARRRKKS